MAFTNTTPITSPEDVQDLHCVPLSKGDDKRDIPVPDLLAALLGQRPWTRPPVAADWERLDIAGTGSIIDVGRAVSVRQASTGGVLAYRAVGIAAPWRATAVISADLAGWTLSHVGMLARSSVSGKYTTHQYRGNSGFYIGGNYAADGSWAGTLVYDTFYWGRVSPFLWLRITHDGTNMVYQAGIDGETWRTMATQSKATHFGSDEADQAGLYIDGPASAATLLSWKVEPYVA